MMVTYYISLKFFWNCLSLIDGRKLYLNHAIQRCYVNFISNIPKCYPRSKFKNRFIGLNGSSFRTISSSMSVTGPVRECGPKTVPWIETLIDSYFNDHGVPRPRYFAIIFELRDRKLEKYSFVMKIQRHHRFYLNKSHPKTV